MEQLAEELQEQLDCATVFYIGPYGIKESIVVTWIIMAFIALVCFLMTRKLEPDPTKVSKRQLIVETAVDGLRNLVHGIVGEEAKEYGPYLMAVVLYLGISNIIGLVGFKPPTKDLNVTAGLALMSIILIQYAGIHKKGVKGWLHSFIEPVGIMLPFNLLELVIKPVSLCMRLFGNVLGAFVIMELIKAILPVGLPIPFSMYFDIFDGLIQAYVFIFLTGLYIKEAVE
ncbi:MAG: F0F1 ATP synthase subunit A [Lachnospiraceae bacterium]|nr:F0F1 ATP synthase subunit A [Lachnospiraceae bacterium]